MTGEGDSEPVRADRDDGLAARDASRLTYDRMARAEARFAKPVTPEQMREPLAQVDALGWLGGNIRGWRVLCLAAGGGRQGPLYAAAGGEVTVVDISPEMLRLDRAVAHEYQLQIKTVETSMDDLSMFATASFDLCIHPVSTCYLPRLAPVFQAIARVVHPAGLYISQHKSPVSLQTSIAPVQGRYQLETSYYDPRPLPPVSGSRLREEGAIEYLHRWEEIIGGICRAGFVIEDLVEPCHGKGDAEPGSFAHRGQYIAPYVRIKARRRGEASPSGNRSRLALPWQD